MRENYTGNQKIINTKESFSSLYCRIRPSNKSANELKLNNIYVHIISWCDVLCCIWLLWYLIKKLYKIAFLSLCANTDAIHTCLTRRRSCKRLCGGRWWRWIMSCSLWYTLVMINRKINVINRQFEWLQLDGKTYLLNFKYLLKAVSSLTRRWTIWWYCCCRRWSLLTADTVGIVKVKGVWCAHTLDCVKREK